MDSAIFAFPFWCNTLQTMKSNVYLPVSSMGIVQSARFLGTANLEGKAICIATSKRKTGVPSVSPDHCRKPNGPGVDRRSLHKPHIHLALVLMPNASEVYIEMNPQPFTNSVTTKPNHSLKGIFIQTSTVRWLPISFIKRPSVSMIMYTNGS